MWVMIRVAGGVAAALGTLVLIAGPSRWWLAALFILGQPVFGDGGDTMLPSVYVPTTVG